MAADAQEIVKKVDSAVSGLSSSPEDKKGHAKKASSAGSAEVFNINDLGMPRSLLGVIHFANTSFRKGRKRDQDCSGNTEAELVCQHFPALNPEVTWSPH